MQGQLRLAVREPGTVLYAQPSMWQACMSRDFCQEKCCCSFSISLHNVLNAGVASLWQVDVCPLGWHIPSSCFRWTRSPRAGIVKLLARAAD
jgi:hypothetical protein